MPVKTTNTSLNKNDYFKSDVVESFIKFLAGYVSNSKGFEHKYCDRKSGKAWSCYSVFNAYKNYSYPLINEFRVNDETDFNSFDANSTVLKDLAEKLQCAFGKRQNSDNPACSKSENALLKASHRVFVWGGVAGAKTRKDNNTRSGNYLWLEEEFPDGKDLADAYKCAEKTFTADKPDLSNIGKAGIRSNAGFTKIYSLLFDDFIIYDSRVAAALGLFVVKFCKEKKLTGIPDELNFGWMPPKEGKNSKDAKVRDPRSGELVHHRANSERRHAHSNIRANWILVKVLSNDYSSERSPFNEINNSQDKLRALEAAFFMIGYDIGKHSWLSKLTEKNEPEVGQSDYSNTVDSEFELKTIAKNEPFTVKKIDLGYQFVVGKSNSKLFLPESFIAEIETDMEGEELKIGASRDNPPKGSLGERLNSKVCTTAMASYVAPLLVHLGVAVVLENDNKRTIRVL